MQITKQNVCEFIVFLLQHEQRDICPLFIAHCAYPIKSDYLLNNSLRMCKYVWVCAFQLFFILKGILALCECNWQKGAWQSVQSMPLPAQDLNLSHLSVYLSVRWSVCLLKTSNLT